MIKAPGLAASAAGKEAKRRRRQGGSRRGRYLLLCITDYEHTQSTKAGAPGVDPGQLITESRLFPQRQTDVATGAPRCDRKVNADRVLFGRKHRLKCCQNRGIEPTQGRGVRTTPASTRGHMWMGARTRTHELFGAIRSYSASYLCPPRIACKCALAVLS